MKTLIVIAISLLLASSAWGKEKTTTEIQELLLKGIWMVESGGRMNPPDGDNGEAKGPFQIRECSFNDAAEVDKEVGTFTHEDCRNFEKAKKVVIAYWKRYAREAWETEDLQVLARIHNGGPYGHKKKSTLQYWEKVKKEIQKIEKRNKSR